MTATSRATPVLLWTRAALIAVVVVLVSTIGHASADGLLPGPLAFAALFLGSTVAAARFLTRPASTTRMVGLLVTGQAVIHGLLSTLAGHAGDRGPSSPPPAHSGGFVFEGRHVERTGSYLDQVEAMQPAAGPAVPDGATAGVAWLSHQVEHLTSQNPLMLLAHLVAVVLLGLWLAVGEQALWTVVCLATSTFVVAVARAVCRLAVGLLAHVVRRVGRRPVPHGVGRDVVRHRWLLRHVVAHRGPPAPLLAS